MSAAVTENRARLEALLSTLREDILRAQRTGDDRALTDAYAARRRCREALALLTAAPARYLSGAGIEEDEP